MWPRTPKHRHPPELAARVAELLDSRCAALPGCIADVVILVGLPGGNEVLRCFAGAGRSAAADEHAPFQVMSISKPVAAFGALRLAHLGVIDLDAPVVDLLRTWTFPPDRTGGFDPRGITVRRILCHAAGLNIHGYDWAPLGDLPSASQLLDGLGDPNNALRIIAEPGARALYSGGGYTLLQQIIEDVTGRGYADVMRDTVLAPLGMTRSTFDASDPLVAGAAMRHDAEGQPLPPARIAALACSGLYSTSRDLTRFLRAVHDARENSGAGLIPPEAAAAMQSTQTLDAHGRGWSLGFYMLSYDRGDIFHHGGLKQGWWSQIDGVAGRGQTIVTLTSGDSSEVHIKPIIADLRQLLLEG